MSALGDRLRAAREAKGLTLRQLGALVGVSNAALSQMEHGTIARPRQGTLYLLAQQLDVPYLELLELAGYSEVVALDDKRAKVAGAAFLGVDDLSKQEAEEVEHFIQMLRRRRAPRDEKP